MNPRGPRAVGGDPAALGLLAAGGAGQAFTLDHRARLLDQLERRHRDANGPTAVDARPVVAGLRWLAARVDRLDRWVAHVAAALAAADAAGGAALGRGEAARRLTLLTFGPSHPLAEVTVDAPSATPVDPDALPVTRLAAADLDALAAAPSLPARWRDRIHRERIHRWVARLEQRVAAVPPERHGPGAWFVAWFDRRVVDLVSPVTDLHTTRAEHVARLRDQVTGVRRLLATPGLTVLSFDPRTATPGAGPAVRVAFGDVDTASHLAVLVPGTATGLHRPEPSVADARALHAAASDGRAAAVATVLDLHDAPADLGRAADPRTGRAVATATAAFLAGLPTPPDGTVRRTTLVGHSYGALTAAEVTRVRPVDALVLLGAPGVGARHRDELGAGEVWAAQAPWDPIALVADLDELQARAPWGGEHWRDDPSFAHGPDPADPEFGALRLPTASDGRGTRGHLAYLDPAAGTLPHVAAVVAGTASAPGGRSTVRRTAPRSDPRAARRGVR